MVYLAYAAYAVLAIVTLTGIIIGIVMKMHRLVYSGDRLTGMCFFSVAPNVVVVIDHGEVVNGQQVFEKYQGTWHFFAGKLLGDKFVIAIDTTVQSPDPAPMTAIANDGVTSKVDLRYTYFPFDELLFTKKLATEVTDQWADATTLINEELRGVVNRIVAGTSSINLSRMNQTQRETMQNDIRDALNILIVCFGLKIKDISIERVVINEAVNEELQRQKALELALVNAGIEKNIMREKAAGMRAYTDEWIDSTKGMTWRQTLASTTAPLMQTAQAVISEAIGGGKSGGKSGGKPGGKTQGSGDDDDNNGNGNDNNAGNGKKTKSNRGGRK